MSTRASTPTAGSATGQAQHFSRLREFIATAEGRPALLGCLGAVLITTGGLGAGSTKQHDPLLESLHLSWLRFGHGLVLSSVLLWLGVALMLIAWLVAGPTCSRRQCKRIHHGGHHRLLAGTATAVGAGLQPRHLLVSGPGRTAARRPGPICGRAGREPESVAGQRESHLDHHHGTLRSGIHHDCQTGHDAGRQSCDRRNHVAAPVHAARPGAADLGDAPAGPSSRRRCAHRAVDLCAQPAGDHPSDGRSAQRDADGGPDDRRHRADSSSAIMSRASRWSLSESRSRPRPESRCRFWSGYGCAICAIDADTGRYRPLPRRARRLC